MGANDEQQTFLRWWRSRRDFAAGMAWLVLAVGIGVVVVATSAWTRLEGVFGASPEQAICNGRLARPLTSRDVVVAFRAEGFTMRDLPRSIYCDPHAVRNAESIVGEVSNKRSLSRQGWAICVVRYRAYRRPPYRLSADLIRGPDSPIFSGHKAVFEIANVECRLYPHGTAGSEQIARAHVAMKRLTREVST